MSSRCACHAFCLADSEVFASCSLTQSSSISSSRPRAQPVFEKVCAYACECVCKWACEGRHRHLHRLGVLVRMHVDIDIVTYRDSCIHHSWESETANRQSSKRNAMHSLHLQVVQFSCSLALLVGRRTNHVICNGSCHDAHRIGGSNREPRMR